MVVCPTRYPGCRRQQPRWCVPPGTDGVDVARASSVAAVWTHPPPPVSRLTTEWVGGLGWCSVWLVTWTHAPASPPPQVQVAARHGGVCRRPREKAAAASRGQGGAWCVAPPFRIAYHESPARVTRGNREGTSHMLHHTPHAWLHARLAYYFTFQGVRYT